MKKAALFRVSSAFLFTAMAAHAIDPVAKCQSSKLKAWAKLFGIPRGATGRSKILIRGKGSSLASNLVPALSLPVTAQLVNDTTAACFDGVYGLSDVTVNAAGRFKAKAE